MNGVELFFHGHDLLVASGDFVFGVLGLLLRGLEFILDLKNQPYSYSVRVQYGAPW